MIKFSWGSLGILLPAVVIFYIVFNTNYWRENKYLIESDIVSYYTYLPAIFIHQDPSLKYVDKLDFSYREKIWYESTEDGGRVIKTTMGVAYFYFPFFMLAHHYCLNSDDYLADGYSLPYRFAISMSSIFYLLLALFFLKRLLNKYFSELTTFFVLISLSIGTNLLNYVTREPGMSHCYNFFLISIFIYFTDRWVSTSKQKHFLYLAGILSLILLTRPTNAIVALIILLYRVESIEALKVRFYNVFGDWKLLTKAFLVVLLVLAPQMIYWKYNSGDWLFFSYTDNEKFFFNDPMILKGLFSYRKGWFIYTPIMLLAMIGFFLPSKSIKGTKFPFSLILIIHIYIVFSWWAWWYGGGYGARPMIDMYPILAIPMAFFFNYFDSKKVLVKILPFTVAILLVSLSIFQNYQYRIGLIHYQGMTEKTYWGVFLKEEYPKGYWDELDIPDYDAAKKGDRDI